MRLGLFILFTACIETQSGLLPFSDGNVYKIDHTAGGVGRGCCAFRRQIIAWVLFIAYERYVGRIGTISEISGWNLRSTSGIYFLEQFKGSAVLKVSNLRQTPSADTRIFLVANGNYNASSPERA